jgi:uncharacterized membrane protein
MLRRIACLALLSALAACSPEISEGEPAAASASPIQAESMTLSGVALDKPLRILGTEPFWAITTDDNDVLLERPDAAPQHFTPSGFHVTGNQAELRSTTLSIVLTPGPCSDGMSDRQYPLTAEVRLDDKVLKGCALPKAEADKARP